MRNLSCKNYRTMGFAVFLLSPVLVIVVVLAMLSAEPLDGPPLTVESPSGTITQSLDIMVPVDPDEQFTFLAPASSLSMFGASSVELLIEGEYGTGYDRLFEMVDELIDRDPEYALNVLLSKQITLRRGDGSCIGFGCDGE